jgi:hypothetical protein
VTLAVTGNTISGRSFSTLQGDGVSEASTAVDRKSMDLRLVIYSGKTPTFCVFPVFSVAVMEKCCDACGDGEYYFRSKDFRRYRVTVCQRHRLPLNGKSMRYTVG